MRFNTITCLMMLACVAMLPASCTRADQDDIDNNADLQDTPEEIARAVILKRWPEAKGIDVLDLTEDEDDDMDEGEKAPATAAKEGDTLDMLREKFAKFGDKLLAEDDDDDMDEADDVATDFCLSVTFLLNDKEYEALMNDKGVIRYVYEEVPVEDAPVKVMKAAREAVKTGDFLYVDKVLNETKTPHVTSYIIGVGEKDVYVDDSGKLLKVEDAPPDDDAKEDGKEPEAPMGADGML